MCRLKTITRAEQEWNESFIEEDEDENVPPHYSDMNEYLEHYSRTESAVHPEHLDTMDSDGHTPLHFAVMNHQPLMVQALLVAGADMWLRSYCGNTALHIACLEGDVDCVKAILIHRNIFFPRERTNDCLELRNNDGKTCLHIAAEEGHLEIVSWLVIAGANTCAQTIDCRQTPLHLAVEKDHHKVVRFLARECPSCLTLHNDRGLTAYQMAKDKEPLIAQDLSDFGASSSLYLQLKTFWNESCYGDKSSRRNSYLRVYVHQITLLLILFLLVIMIYLLTTKLKTKV